MGDLSLGVTKSCQVTSTLALIGESVPFVPVHPEPESGGEVCQFQQSQPRPVDQARRLLLFADPVVWQTESGDWEMSRGEVSAKKNSPTLDGSDCFDMNDQLSSSRRRKGGLMSGTAQLQSQLEGASQLGSSQLAHLQQRRTQTGTCLQTILGTQRVTV